MGIAGRHDSLLNTTTPLCVFLLVIIISASSGKADTNLLLTKETLKKNSELSYANSNVRLKLEDTCNLVLYDATGHNIWETHTSHNRSHEPKCTVTLTDDGRLLLNGTWLIDIPFSWISPNAPSKVGKYVAILRPEGKLPIFGPWVWAARLWEESIGSDNNDNEIVSSITNLKSPQTVYNVLFSGQELRNNSKLTDGEYTLILQECELFLKKSDGTVLWHTPTTTTKDCIARLDHYAKLAIQQIIYPYKSVWTNTLDHIVRYGEYALVVQKNIGNAVIYGPEVWYAPGPKVWSAPHGESGLIQMRAAEK